MPTIILVFNTHPQISSDLPEFDALPNVGIERGTVTLLSGPTGVGNPSYYRPARSSFKRSCILYMAMNKGMNHGFPW
jgi:predicted ATP-dependent serine protease